LPAEEAKGDRLKCIQEALLTRIREDGDLMLKLAYDVPPTFAELDELHQADGKIDSRDMAVAKLVLDQAKPRGSKIPPAKINVILEAFREADQDGDGVLTEGEFNAYAMDNKHLAHKKEDLPDMPDLHAQPNGDVTQSALRSRKLQGKLNQPAEKEKKVKQTGLAYFQHLFRLGMRVYRAEEKLQHPIAVLALNMYRGVGLPSSNGKEML